MSKHPPFLKTTEKLLEKPVKQRFLNQKKTGEKKLIFENSFYTLLLLL